MHMVQVPFGNTMVSRMAPDVGPEHFKTYKAVSPLKSHWRRATCEEIDCPAMKAGFVTTIDFSTELGQRQLYYLTKEDKDRHPIIQRTGKYQVKLVYRPGTPCMERASHRVPLEREPYFLVCGGDWRGNPRRVQTVKHSNGMDWADDFGNHQIKIKELQKRG